MVETTLTAFITLVVILDPLGNVLPFLALSKGLDEPGRRRAATTAVLVAFGIIIGFALLGRAVTDYLGISVESLSVAGGLLLGLVALDMLRGLYDIPEAIEAGNIALVPLGTPLIAGPGAIAATMVLIQQHASATGRGGVSIGIVAALAVVWVTLRLAVPIGRRIAESAIHLLSRVMGLLLAAIAVGLVLSGIQDWLDKH